MLIDGLSAGCMRFYDTETISLWFVLQERSDFRPSGPL